MSRNTLGISWVHGRFQAVAMKGGRKEACWACPDPVGHETEFAAALAEAVRQTGFSGRRVVVVLEHRSLLFHVQETPPARGRVLKQLLARLVSQSRFFEGPAAWGRLELPPSKGKHRHLLALLPESLLRQLEAACLGQHLQLSAVLPVAAVLGQHLRELSMPREEVVVLAADLGGPLQLLLGRGDGQTLFSRSVPLTGGQAHERAAQEINRTLHYAQQQFGANVNRLVVYGDRALEALSNVEFRQGLVIEQSPVVGDEFHFARQAAQLSPRTPLNLVSHTEQRRRLARRVAAAALLSLLGGTGATVFCVEQTVHARERKAIVWERALAEETRNQAAVLAEQREARRLQAFLQLTDARQHPPVPEVFARYLAARVPEAIRLTELSINGDTNGWNFALRGWVQDSRSGFLAVLEQFEKELEQGVFKARILAGTRSRILHGEGASGGGVKAGGRPEEKPFETSGVIE